MANLETDGIKWLVRLLPMQRFCDRAAVIFVSATKSFAFIPQAIENFLCAKNCGYREK